jgi:hypothetical protein
VRIFLIAGAAGAVFLLLSAPGLAAESTQPCELLTESLVREFYEIPADTLIEQDDSSSSRFPNCGYRWRVMSEADQKAAEAANQAKMMENIKAGKPPTDGIDYNIPTHEQVRITATAFDSDEKAQSALESAKAYLIGRAEQKGQEPTPWDPVEGVGDKAYYHGKQLSFTWDRILIHLDVSPRERAIDMAQAVME